MKTGRVIQMLQHDTVLLHALSRMCVNGKERTVGAVTKEVEFRSKNSEWACRVTTDKPKNMMGRAWVRSRASIYGIYGGQRDTGTSFSPSIWFSRQCHSTNAPCSFTYLSQALYNLSN